MNTGEMSRREFVQLVASAIALTDAARFTPAAKAASLPELPPPQATQWLASPSTRRRECLNRDWKFLLGDNPQAAAPGFSDNDWQAIGLPHSFSLPYFQGKDFYVGFGWYRRSIAWRSEWAGKSVSLEFEAAFQDAEIYINGRQVGLHKGGYTSFECDITSHLTPGENLLAVRVNNLWNPELAPRAGDHIFDGGLYRNVWLVVTDTLRIGFQGLHVTTPKVSRQSANVALALLVENRGSQRRHATVHSAVISPSGKEVASAVRSIYVSAGMSVSVTQELHIAHPELWHPDSPQLYRVVATLLEDGSPVDDDSAPLGLRWFEWTAEQGFFLNGSHVWLRGANVHQDRAGWASGGTDAGAWRDVRLIKEAGFNFIRTSHYPHSRAFMQACDYYGILVWSEMCFWGVGGFGPDGNWRASAYPVQPEHWNGFEASCLQQLQEMIAMHRNHPCIIAWSMCNEVFFTDPRVFQRMKHLLRRMVARTHKLDNTRPAGIGGAQRGGVDKLGDIAGYNGDGAVLYLNPGFPNLVTEYGSVVAPRPGRYSPNWGMLQRTHFAWRSGAAIWCGFDYGTWVGVTGEMGIVDYFRLPKRSWLWYRAHYAEGSPVPTTKPGHPARLQLSTDRPIIQGTCALEDAHIVVEVLDAQGHRVAAAPPVDLKIVSGPGQFPTGRSIRFHPNSDITIANGLAAIEFRSYHGGETIVQAFAEGLEPATLRIQTHGEPAFVPGQTPLAAERAYIKHITPNQNNYATRAPGAVNIALNRPTASSSSLVGHPSRLINDGDPHTWWQVPASSPAQWCQVDLEGIHTLHRIEITVPPAPADAHGRFGSYTLVVATGNDGAKWQPVGGAVRVRPGKMISLSVVRGTRCRYVRVTLEKVPRQCLPGICELVVLGSE